MSEVTPHIGYLHRCAEKIGENLTPRQWIPYTDRMDYLAGMNMNLGWSLAVEKLLGLRGAGKGPAPAGDHRRAEPDRQPPGGDGGLWARPGNVSARFCMPSASGRRSSTCSKRSAVPGSPTATSRSAAQRPICRVAGWRSAKHSSTNCEPRIDEYHTLLTTNAIFIKRTAGIGVMPPEMAISYGCSGPVLRGSGVDHDLRRDGEEIYTAMYDGYAFEVIVEKDGHYPYDHDYPPVPHEAVLGDCWHRFYVRMLEVMQSIDLVRQAIDRYSPSTGSYGEPVKLNQKLPKGEVYLETEAPQGPDGFLPGQRRVRRFRGGHGPAAVVSAICR